MGVFTDAGISGTKADRPGLVAALAAVGKGDALVVYSLSRLSRSTRHMLELSDRLEKVGADLVSISEKIDTTSAAGKMVFRMLAVMAEFERDQISERTTTAMQHKKSKGERVGSIPYGSKLASDGVNLESDEVEQEIIGIVRKLNGDGMSLRKIASKLQQQGFQSRGAKWHPQTIANILIA